MHSPPCILIVDDNPINIKLLEKSLEKGNYTILKAKNGQEGYEITLERKPDLILLDIMMPEMDGYEACTLLKSREETKHIPVIFITAMSDMNDKIKGLDIGAIDYITKPFNSVEVLARVRTQLKLKEMYEENMNYQKILMEAQKTASIGILSEGIAHNFNNLLSINSCYADMLKNVLEDNTGKKYIEKIIQTTERMKKIVKSLLDFVEQGEAPVESVRINAFIEKTVEFFKESHSEKTDITIEMELEETDYKVFGNEKQMLQALRNILINAWEAITPPGKIFISTSLCRELKGKTDDKELELFMCLSIKDTGKGIKEEYKEKIFLPFFTTKNTVGVGLSLSTACGIIKNHGGTITVESSEGQGSTFKIYLPLKSKA